MSHHYDAILIGAGHNGLTCACCLARSGLKVLVVEQYHTVSGMTVTEEETLPGFWSDIHASGEEIPAGRLIISNTDPDHLIASLLGAEMVGPDIVDKMKRYEWGDSIFVMFVALENPVNYKAGPAARQSAHVHLTKPSIDFFSRVYLECRGGALPSAPMIVSWNDSAIDPSRAHQPARR